MNRKQRNELCPICGSTTDSVLQLHFSVKMKLPTDPEIRHCASDDFLFVASGRQEYYDEYYKALVNDSYHGEVSGGSLHSPIAMLQRDYLVGSLGSFFARPRKVLDFGCGEASLLVELASDFQSSAFWGFDPGPAAQVGSGKATTLGLSNLRIADLKIAAENGPYDLVIASHVVEHLVDFDLLRMLKALLAEDGLLYLEVPNPLQYEMCERQEFLYYFDRLHVNHFTPQALTRLVSGYGFGYMMHFEYAFPYREGDRYPALGMLLKKGGPPMEISSPSLLDATQRYITLEKKRAKAVAGRFDDFEGVLVWGAGDNFYRSVENDGPLSQLRNMIVLDRRPQEIALGGRRFATENPHDGIRRYPWPVVIAISEARKSISEQVNQIDPRRAVFFV